MSEPVHEFTSDEMFCLDINAEALAGERRGAFVMDYLDQSPVILAKPSDHLIDDLGGDSSLRNGEPDDETSRKLFYRGYQR